MSENEKSPSNELQSFEGPNTSVSVSKYDQYTHNTVASTIKDQPRRIDPDSHKMLWIAVGLVGFVGAISFMVSYSGLVAVAEWAGLPPAMRWAVPIFIDTAILVYSIAVLIHRSRGEKTWASWTSLAAFTLVSVLANVGHVLLDERSMDDFRTWIGALVAGMAPIGVFAATEELGRLAIARPHERQAFDAGLVPVGDDRPNPTPPTPRPDSDQSALNDVTPVAAAEHARRPVKGQRSPDLVPASANLGEALGKVESTVAEWGRAQAVEPSHDTTRAPRISATVSAGMASSNGQVDPWRNTLPVADTVAIPVEEPAGASVTGSAVSGDGDQPRSMSSVRYLDPAAEEERILHALLTEHGRDLTAKHIANALGKVVRTGQRKLAKLQKQHPEIFTSDAQEEA
ncbi:DUF2637 domain-containing protein [Glutamicibacter uratoxydans]|uniref:DUF2637 domain-containing protein n=1 Tax=Glutamicibacter uratoxydans TaxID=43667 RepID=UPI003D6E9C47